MLITRVHHRARSFALTLLVCEGKESQAQKKKEQPFPEMPPFVVVASVLSSEKEKIYRGIICVEKSKQESRLRFFFRFNSNNPKENKREDAQKLKAL